MWPNNPSRDYLRAFSIWQNWPAGPLLKLSEQISQFLNADMHGVEGFFVRKLFKKRRLHFRNDRSSRKVLTLGEDASILLWSRILTMGTREYHYETKYSMNVDEQWNNKGVLCRRTLLILPMRVGALSDWLSHTVLNYILILARAIMRLADVSNNRLKWADVPGIRLPFNYNL